MDATIPATVTPCQTASYCAPIATTTSIPAAATTVATNKPATEPPTSTIPPWVRNIPVPDPGLAATNSECNLRVRAPHGSRVCGVCGRRRLDLLISRSVGKPSISERMHVVHPLWSGVVQRTPDRDGQ